MTRRDFVKMLGVTAAAIAIPVGLVLAAEAKPLTLSDLAERYDGFVVKWGRRPTHCFVSPASYRELQEEIGGRHFREDERDWCRYAFRGARLSPDARLAPRDLCWMWQVPND